MLSLKLTEKKDQFYQIQKLIRLIQGYLAAENMETERIFLNLSMSENFPALPFLKNLRFSRQIPPRDSWRQAMENFRGEGRDILLSIGDILGRYDSQTQIGQLESLLSVLAPSVLQAEERCQKEGKLCLSGGVLLAMLSVVMFL